MKTLIKQIVASCVAKARELNWRAIWQAAMPTIISGILLKIVVGH
jgi:hypothetical protein